VEINQAPARGSREWEVVPAGAEDRVKEAGKVAAVGALVEIAFAPSAVKLRRISGESLVRRSNARIAASIWSENSNCSLRFRNNNR